MINILAQDNITNKEIKIFLDDTRKEVEVLIKRFTDSKDNTPSPGLEDANNLHDICKTISEKIASDSPYTSKDKEDLKNLLLTVKKNIEIGIIDGTASGINKYINQLEK